jgi:uncharacterized membrane protein
MNHHVPAVVYLHLAAAAGAILIGGVQLLRPKGTAAHRVTGWVWVALMFALAVSSLWIPGFLRFTWIHLFTLLTLVTLPLALYRIRHGNVAGHARAMRSLYAGGLVIAGIFTLSPGRLLGDLVWKGCWAC